MNGAESLVESLIASGIDTCFGNPGTSEMHVVAALCARSEMRCVLGLSEGVVTGAADGFGRMAGRPAMTLLHCGAGLANGAANLHNAKRANTMMINCVGDLATYFQGLGSPLAADIETIAAPFSDWVRRSSSTAELGRDAAEAAQEALAAPGRIATLIVPSDIAWGESGVPARVLPPAVLERVADEGLAEALDVLRSGERTGLIIGGAALRREGLEAVAAIVQASGATALAPQTIARMERGRGLPAIDRIPVPAALAREKLAGFRHLILIGATLPSGFFAYRGLPHQIVDSSTKIHKLCEPRQDVLHTVQALASALGAPVPKPSGGVCDSNPARGSVSPDALGISACALLPEQAIVVDESIVVGRALFSSTIGAAPHDWLQTTGGAIGDGIPLAVGAAVACPDRRVVNFQADGSAMYTLQGLWTQARERLPVTTVILANRSYAVLHQELERAGLAPKTDMASAMLDLDDPELDWVALAKGMGIEAALATQMEEFNDLFVHANRSRAPFLIQLQC